MGMTLASLADRSASRLRLPELPDVPARASIVDRPHLRIDPLTCATLSATVAQDEDRRLRETALDGPAGTMETETARPFLTAAERRRRDPTETLLRRPWVNPDTQGEDGDAPIHRASEQGHVEVLELLIAAGADVDRQNSRGDTAAHLAAEHGHDRCLELLIES